MNWFQRCIRDYSVKANCRYKLLRKGEKFIWKKEHQVAFDELKYALMNSDALAFPRYDLPFYLAIETSSKGINLIRAIYERWNLILRFNINLLNN